MPDVKVNRVAAFELNGQFYPSMAEAELAVREAVILDIIDADLSSQASHEDIAACVARQWGEIKRRCDAAFAGV
jgi:hypothetical protein